MTLTFDPFNAIMTINNKHKLNLSGHYSAEFAFYGCKEDEKNLVFRLNVDYHTNVSIIKQDMTESYFLPCDNPKSSFITLNLGDDIQIEKVNFVKSHRGYNSEPEEITLLSETLYGDVIEWKPNLLRW